MEVEIIWWHVEKWVLHSEWGLKTASQRRWHFRGECVYIICFVHFMAVVLATSRTIKADILPYDIRSRKEKGDGGAILLHSAQTNKFESSCAASQSQVPRHRGVCQLVVLSPLTSALLLSSFPLGHTVAMWFWGGEGISGVYKSVVNVTLKSCYFKYHWEGKTNDWSFSSACVCKLAISLLIYCIFLERKAKIKIANLGFSFWTWSIHWQPQRSQSVWKKPRIQGLNLAPVAFAHMLST